MLVEAHPSRAGLTPQQRKCLDAITNRLEHSRGVSPSYEEIMADMGLQSKSGVKRLIDGLVDRGWLTMRNNKMRSLMIAKHACPTCGGNLR